MPTFDQIKTPSQLKSFILNNDEESHFFDRKTMQFFGDTMQNFGIKRHTTSKGLVIELYRKKQVKHGVKSSHFWVLKEDTKDTVQKADYNLEVEILGEC